ncbi:MAG: tRNA 2-selenouridine(34) synthase MnmH [Aquabacterium sp.]|nr:tRNA 2-selenouridine(34) synthase MnmH [Aquabacterium sp.]
MSARGPIQVADRHLFDCIIDARSPSEFALDHIPGAINCPVLDDDERRIVGTIYKQQGAFEARRVGGAMVAANLARHLQGRFAHMPHDWKPLIYCWRGGLRSGSMVAWWRLVGWDAQQLAGGYKRWRQHVIATLEALCPQLPLRVVCGATGSAKTRVLHALAEQGAQVLDLEGLACHKGSLLGAMPGVDQPSQKAFETQLATVLEGFDLSRPVFVEAESRKIGRISLPTALIERMRASPCLEIAASGQARQAYLLRDYAYLGDDGDTLAERLEVLTPLHGKDTIARWQGWARHAQLAPLFAELTELHYDPLYARSQATHFHQWAQRQVVHTDALDEPAMAQLAQQLRALT